jgi:hypothetical protein
MWLEFILMLSGALLWTALVLAVIWVAVYKLTEDYDDTTK